MESETVNSFNNQYLLFLDSYLNIYFQRPYYTYCFYEENFVVNIMLLLICQKRCIYTLYLDELLRYLVFKYPILSLYSTLFLEDGFVFYLEFVVLRLIEVDFIYFSVQFNN